MTHNSETYNGWTNYETWRVNLEFFDGFDPSDLWNTHAEDVDSLTDSLADTLEDIAGDMAHGEREAYSFASSLVSQFLRRVNWREIAEHMVHDYRDQWPSALLEDDELAARD